LFIVADCIRLRFGRSAFVLLQLVQEVLVHPGHSGQLAPCRIPNPVFDPVLLGAFVGHGVDVNRSSGPFVLKLISNPFALLGYLEEKLVVGSRR
jgi:hypothetical protein